MNQVLQRTSAEYIRTKIREQEKALEVLRADLLYLESGEPEIPAWRGSVSSAWRAEGEPDWNGTVVAPTVRDAVYQVMMEFCKKAKRVYPGYQSPTTRRVFDHFDLQGQVYVGLKLPGGTIVPVERARLDGLTKEFNKRAPIRRTHKAQATPQKGLI